MCTHKRQTICFCLSCLIANPFFKPDSFPVDMNFFTIKSPLDEINKISFTHSMLPHHVDERWFLASERTDLHEIHSQKMFWFVEKLLCNDRDCVVSSTSNTGKTIFKEKNWATSWIVILVYLLVSPFHETHCSWRDEFLIWISLYFPEEFSLNSWTVFGGHGCGRSKKHF